MMSARRHSAKALVAAGPAAAGARATPPADGVERPGQASAVIVDRASFSRRSADPLEAIRSIGPAASLRPARQRIAIAWAALQGRRSAAALRIAQPQALRAR